MSSLHTLPPPFASGACRARIECCRMYAGPNVKNLEEEEEEEVLQPEAQANEEAAVAFPHSIMFARDVLSGQAAVYGNCPEGS